VASEEREQVDTLAGWFQND